MKNRQQALRKAAILIASLERETADSLLAQMTPDQADAVLSAIDALGDVAPREQEAVVEEFFRIGPLVPEKAPPGIELDSRLAQQLGEREPHPFSHSSPQRERSIWGAAGELAGASRGQPFRLLEDTSSAALAEYLEREHPQTIAVVVSHLAGDRAAELLSLLPPELQGEVVLRLAHLDKTDPEILEEIERGMQDWIAQQFRTSVGPAAGFETLRGILAAADERSKSTILRNLAQRDRRLAGKLSAPPERSLSFAELEQFDDAALANVLRHASNEIVRLALAGAGNEFVGRVLRLVPADEARLLRRGLENLGPTRLSDVERAQHELGASGDYDRLLRNDDLEEAVVTLGKIIEEGGGWRRDAPEAIRWVDQFAADLQTEKVRFYNRMKGKT